MNKKCQIPEFKLNNVLGGKSNTVAFITYTGCSSKFIQLDPMVETDSILYLLDKFTCTLLHIALLTSFRRRIKQLLTCERSLPVELDRLKVV